MLRRTFKPNNHTLLLIARPAPSEDYIVQARSGKAKISIHKQQELRDTCAMIGIDPETINMPALKEIKIRPEKLLALGNTKLAQKITKDQKIAENMAQMDKRVAAYRKERRDKKLAARPDMPF